MLYIVVSCLKIASCETVRMTVSAVEVWDYRSPGEDRGNFWGSIRCSVCKPIFADPESGRGWRLRGNVVVVSQSKGVLPNLLPPAPEIDMNVAVQKLVAFQSIT